jgi:hypothetical protein
MQTKFSDKTTLLIGIKFLCFIIALYVPGMPLVARIAVTVLYIACLILIIIRVIKVDSKLKESGKQP